MDGGVVQLVIELARGVVRQVFGIEGDGIDGEHDLAW